ncbi:hypothetical protein PGT21_018612 [Puccinia graminis f. sp. tritici]|uniref:Uncharacterized protein n=1 Tax=Puccinia graminis f. sp. tritici TaxID=56615 RepID=A0A5B0MN21_PUCGR|nr:hypothetical protein PGT21_018612 [Puccinia graminis f. sp. tritici]
MANYTLQSIALNQLLVQAIELDPPQSVPILLMSTYYLEPVAGILWALSAIPAIRKEGFWFFKTEKNGMIRPNTRTLIPIFLLFYIALWPQFISSRKTSTSHTFRPPQLH